VKNADIGNIHTTGAGTGALLTDAAFEVADAVTAVTGVTAEASEWTGSVAVDDEGDFSSVNLAFTGTDAAGVAFSVTIDDNYSTGGLGAVSGNTLVDDIQAQLDATNADVTVAIDGSDHLVFTAGTAGVGGDIAVTGTAGAVSNADVEEVTAVTGVAAKTGLVVDALTIKVGDADAVTLTGTYTDVQDLLDKISEAGAAASIDETGNLTLSAGDTITLTGAGAADIGLTEGATTISTNGLTDTSVTSVVGANDAILRMDAALTSVSTLRSTLGAIQNRFDSTINSLQAVSENLSASRSRIQDTDFASETAALTRAQILQQAGTAMVAQANTVPQNVLSLLR
jgi:flagellin